MNETEIRMRVVASTRGLIVSPGVPIVVGAYDAAMFTHARADLIATLNLLDAIRAAAAVVRRGNPQCPGELVPSQVDALLAAVGGGVYQAPGCDPSALHAIILAQEKRLDAIRAAAKPLFEADLTDHDEDCALRECNSPRNTCTLEPVCVCNCELRHVSALLAAIGEP